MRATIRLLTFIVVLPALLACSDSVEPVPPPPPPPTPEATVLRLIALYEQKDIVEYTKLFTGDFTFEFSNAADPDLVQDFAAGWFKEDEIVSAQNLFQGGVDSEGMFQPGATQIELQLTPTAPGADGNPARDPDLYKVLLASVHLVVDVAGDLTYVIGEAPPQNSRFFLVRGDVAVGLEPDQPADADHWYIWNWRDESPLLKAAAPVQNESSTWGRLKGLYR